MGREQTFFDWEDSFDLIENIQADIYVNDVLKVAEICLEKIAVCKNHSGSLNISLFTKNPVYSALIECEKNIYNLKIEIQIKSLYFW